MKSIMGLELVMRYWEDITHVDGIGIIRIDKEKEKFEDLFLNIHIPDQKIIIDHFISGFGSLLMSYYHNINMKYLFSTYKKQYNLITPFIRYFLLLKKLDYIDSDNYEDISELLIREMVERERKFSVPPKAMTAIWKAMVIK